MRRRLVVLEKILKARISAIIRTTSESLARQAMQAAVDGGFRMIEFTLTTPGACNLIHEFSAKRTADNSSLIVGAGTVLTAEQAQKAVDSGAGFLVSPVIDPKVIEEAHRLDVPVIPGAFTPTEMQFAYTSGADIIKVFPAVPGGPGYIEAVLAPLPHLRLFPTGGITPDNFKDYLAAGCVGAGFVKSLFTPQYMAEQNFAEIRRRAEEIVQALDQP